METESPLADLHRAAGAELGAYFGITLPARFGGDAAEYRAARETAALIDTNFRAVFALTGPDRVRYANAVTTNNVRDLATGQGVTGLLLNAQGHILAELTTLALDDRLILLGHKFIGEQTAATLDKFIIMDDATLTDETAAHGTIAVEGPAAAAVLRDVTGVELTDLPRQGHTTASVAPRGGLVPCPPISCRVIRQSLFGFPSVEFLVVRERLPELWRVLDAAVRAHGGAPIGYRAVNALRLEAGVPWFGVDFDEHNIPQEAALESTHISFTKGCYTGQEIVERVRSRGHVNRRLTGLQFDGAEIPAPATPLMAECGETSGEVGHVTSAAYSHLAGKFIGMGYVRREYQTPGTAFQCGPATARVIKR